LFGIEGRVNSLVDLALLKQAVGDLDEESVIEMLDAFIDSNPESDEVQAVVEACQQGMEIVGGNYERGFRGRPHFCGRIAQQQHR
jgi:methanogenic corrinoid protein MtbC1